MSGYVARLFSGERVEVTFDKTGRPYLLTGEPFVGTIQGNAIRSLKAGDRVEVLYHRANQESFKYVARQVRRVDPAAGAA